MRMNTISLKRIGIYFLGLVILCLGVVLNTKTNLGVAAMAFHMYWLIQHQYLWEQLS